MKKTVYDAVIQERGVWKEEEANCMAVLNEKIHYMVLKPLGLHHLWSGNRVILMWDVICTRAEFEAEAKRVYGESAPYLPEINEECEYSLGGQNYFPCTICYRYEDSCGEHFIIECPHLDNEKQYVSVESETQPVFFRPKKSDRELWVKAAEKVNKAHFWTQTEFLVALYDAMQSGELPVPEVK